MAISLLGQGYEVKSEFSVGNMLIKFLADKDFNTFTGIFAFASQSGVKGLAKYLEASMKHLTGGIHLIVGVDQKGTSKEALDTLLKIGAKTFIYYQPSLPIFHPKIYLFEGRLKSELIIGSSNLTSQGLFSNVETSLLISTEHTNEGGIGIINELKEYFKGLFDFTDPNLKALTRELIDDLVETHIVPLEEERRVLQDKSDKEDRKATKKIILKMFPERGVPKIPFEFLQRSIVKRPPQPKMAITSYVNQTISKGNLVWVRRNLPSSSVQVGGDGTNPTGGLRLVQDNFTVKGIKIDQTVYFRNVLFGRYTWKPVKSTPFVETTKIPFEIIIKGAYIGLFDLEVRHKPSGEAGQGNYTTSISWGDISEVIRETNLTGSRLELYEPKRKGKPFLIFIF
ncbi:MAG: phospholipase D family protein [Bacteroidetes bacterium]|nr:phospholipase D family protein [Bacteroidota bacterium]